MTHQHNIDEYFVLSTYYLLQAIQRGPSDQDGCTAVLSLTVPKLCPAVALTYQDGHHSAVAFLLKAAVILIEQMVSNKKIFMGISYRVLC
jgi:hypothetical protein